MPSSQLTLSDHDRATLESWTRSSTVSAGQRERARIVLAIADGAGTSTAARRVGVSRPTAIKWRERFATRGIAGLDDQPRSGRPKTIDDAQIIAATLEPPPAARVQPWQRETFKFSTDPELKAKVRDVVGLYLDPPEHAIVLCVDEKVRHEALSDSSGVRDPDAGSPQRPGES